jgi:hypothetical protein
MSKRPRRNRSPAVTAKVARAAVKGEKTREGREDPGRVGATVRCPSQPNHPGEDPAPRRGGRRVRGREGCDPTGGREDAACHDRRADPGQCLLRARARQSRSVAERQAMIDRIPCRWPGRPRTLGSAAPASMTTRRWSRRLIWPSCGAWTNSIWRSCRRVKPARPLVAAVHDAGRGLVPRGAGGSLGLRLLP